MGGIFSNALRSAQVEVADQEKCSAGCVFHADLLLRSTLNPVIHTPIFCVCFLVPDQQVVSEKDARRVRPEQTFTCTKEFINN